jgi:Sec-independent protein translocase protein TatA
MEVGIGQLLLIALIAVIVMKPDELRRSMSALGRWMGQMRRLSREFTSELSREADEIEKELEREEKSGKARSDGSDESDESDGSDRSDASEED